SAAARESTETAPWRRVVARGAEIIGGSVDRASARGEGARCRRGELGRVGSSDALQTSSDLFEEGVAAREDAVLQVLELGLDDLDRAGVEREARAGRERRLEP